MQKSKFTRGFKSWCEKKAIEYRQQLGILPYEPLSPGNLLEQYNAVLLDINTLPLEGESKQYLNNEGASEWSAATVACNGKTAIVVNASHSEQRKNNSLMHELAHLILQHAPSQVSIHNSSGIALRSFNEKSEVEADWLAATLLLPKPALLYFRRVNADENQIIQQYAVSRQLLTFRLNVTGLGVRTKIRARTETG